MAVTVAELYFRPLRSILLHLDGPGGDITAPSCGPGSHFEGTLTTMAGRSVVYWPKRRCVVQE